MGLGMRLLLNVCCIFCDCVTSLILYFMCTFRRLGEATMNIISGMAAPVNLMVLQPENGRTLYALSGVEWGALNDATENRDRYDNIMTILGQTSPL